MRVLLDTCIISDLYRPHKAEHIREVLKSIGEENCFVSALTLGEIVHGVNLLQDGKKKRELLLWTRSFEVLYKERIVPIDREAAKIWGELTARARKAGQNIPVVDGLIAASAICHGLYVMTGNAKDFEFSGAQIFDPWSTR